MAQSDLYGRIAEIARDRQAPASELLDRAVEILAETLARGDDLIPVARQLCRAQPSMAPLWNAAAAALADREKPGEFERFVARLLRARKAVVRVAVDLLTDDSSQAPLEIATISMSQSVLAAIAAVGERRRVRVACSESRPALEGRALAAGLGQRGIPVTLYGDAAIAGALDTATIVLLGADAMAPEWFLNKVGSRMLASAAGQCGAPVYVIATRDKFVGAALGARLLAREGPPADIWDAPPAGVEVRNPYFERTPLDLVSAVISDAGVLGTGMMRDACEAAADPAAMQHLLELM